MLCLVPPLPLPVESSGVVSLVDVFACFLVYSAAHADNLYVFRRQHKDTPRTVSMGFSVVFELWAVRDQSLASGLPLDARSSFNELFLSPSPLHGARVDTTVHQYAPSSTFTVSDNGLVATHWYDCLGVTD